MKNFSNFKKADRIIYVYSGKGGVGKSTVSVNIAFTFLNLGYKVGLFDADLSTPSIPTLVKGVKFTDQYMHKNLVMPAKYKGLLYSSTGNLGETTDGSFLSGQYLKGALYQLFFGISWDVDILIIDMPPGTTDLHTNLFYNLEGDILFVTTPHSTSHEDLIRSAALIERFNLNVIGVIENMSYVNCTNCEKQIPLHNGQNLDFNYNNKSYKILSSLPFDAELSYLSSIGVPYMFDKNKVNNHTYLKYMFIASEILKGVK